LVEETASRMFDLESFCFRTLSADGHRLGSVGIPPVSAKSPVDIQLIGPIRKSSGLGQAARLSARMIQQGEYKYSQFDFGIDNPAPEDGVVGGKDSRLCSSRINLIHLNAESVPLVFAYLPDVFRDAYNIGYFYWELDTPANCHYLALDLLDEIWVSSEYGREVYASATDKPVINVGMCFEEVEKVSRVEARRYVQKLVGAPSDAFVFLAAFDSFSFIQRKNPLGVIRAFRAAFPSEPGVRLVLKTHNREFVGDPQQLRIWRAVQAELEADPRIVVMNDTLPYSELRLMKAGCDCYVSLHRSEGWGFGMIEAMASGVPVVATGYSGNMEFCTQENAWLVEHDLVALNPDDYIFVAPGQRWAEPRFESAVSQFRAVFFQGLERERKARAAQEHVHAMFSEDAVSRRYRARLDHLLGAEGPMIGGRRKRRGSHV